MPKTAKNKKQTGNKKKPIKKAKSHNKSIKKASQKRNDWERIIPEDKLSGDKLGGVEAEEAEELANRDLGALGNARKILPSPIDAAGNEQALGGEDVEEANWDYETPYEMEKEGEVELEREGEKPEVSKRGKGTQVPRISYSAVDILVTPGDFIEINFGRESEDRRVIRGKVVEMYSDQSVPGIDEEVVGTAQDPAVKIEVYEEKNQNEWKSTGRFIGLKMSDLQRTVELVDRSKIKVKK